MPISDLPMEISTFVEARGPEARTGTDFYKMPDSSTVGYRLARSASNFEPGAKIATNAAVASGAAVGGVSQGYRALGVNPPSHKDFVSNVGYVELKMGIQQLAMSNAAQAEQVSRLSRTVGELAAAVERLGAPFSLPIDLPALSLSELQRDLGQAIEGDQWMDIFDRAASADLPMPSGLVEAAKLGLISTDAAVRSTAGRALVATGQADLQDAVRAAMSNENNRYVAKVLESALRSAQA